VAELKYEKYIVKGRPPMPVSRIGRPSLEGFDERVERPKLHPLMALSPRMIEGAIIVICQWVFAGEEPGQQGAHTHPYDEIIGFAGTNPEDPNDLGGEAELWMDDEKYMINNSFMVYVPKGLKHCPLIIRDIRKNIFHFDIQLTTGEFREAAA
jgi:hypothetical protein